MPAEWTAQFSESTSYYTSQQSTVTGAVRARDVKCRITGHFTGTQVAHLCPEHESEWFHQNSMSVHNTDFTLDPENLLNDLSNVVLMRSDLHLAFDDRKFTFYPKETSKLVVHMLEPSPDLTQLYHNVQVQPPLKCQPSFLYARFAWAIFPSLAGFLSKPGVSRYLLLSRNTSTGREFVAEEIAKPEQLRAKVSASRSRSPKKRQRTKDWDTQGDSHCCKSSALNKRLRRSAPYVWPQPPAKDTHLHTTKHDINERKQMQPSRAQTAEEELEEDIGILNKRLSPAMVECLRGWYPGWRAVSRLEEQWIAKERSRSGVHVTNSIADDSSIGSDMTLPAIPKMSHLLQFANDAYPKAESCKAAEKNHNCLLETMLKAKEKIRHTESTPETDCIMHSQIVEDDFLQPTSFSVGVLLSLLKLHVACSTMLALGKCLHQGYPPAYPSLAYLGLPAGSAQCPGENLRMGMVNLAGQASRQS